MFTAYGRGGQQHACPHATTFGTPCNASVIWTCTYCDDTACAAHISQDHGRPVCNRCAHRVRRSGRPGAHATVQSDLESRLRALPSREALQTGGVTMVPTWLHDALCVLYVRNN